MNALATGGNGFRRMGALACLLVFMLGPTPLLPMLFAWAASMEGSHAVLIESAMAGGTQVVLRHTQGEAFRNSASGFTHRHGPVSTILCLVARSPGVTGDHIATFTGLSAAEDNPKAPWVEPRCLDSQKQGMVAAANQGGCLSVQIRSPGDYASFSGLTSPSKLERQRCLRSTRLLI